MEIARCEKLWKWYPSPEGRLEVLRGIDLTINGGDFYAVVGASGVGKSTFLHILGLLDAPSDGKIFFDGVDATQLSDDKTSKLRSRSIGFVFQFHHLLPEFSALENLILPQKIAHIPERIAWKTAMEYLSLLGIVERARHYPSQLSGGEQQRVALARSLVNKPKILVADEPTGNLDSENTDRFMDVLETVRAKTDIAIVLATHNMKVAAAADKVLRIVRGKFIEVDKSTLAQ